MQPHQILDILWPDWLQPQPGSQTRAPRRRASVRAAQSRPSTSSVTLATLPARRTFRNTGPADTGPFDPAWDDGSLESGFTWAQNIYTGLTAANLAAFLYLWGANTSTTTVTGPNTGLLDVEGNSVATSGRLWAFASYSRFIRPGAVRIGTTTSHAGLEVSAFRNSDGSLAVVVLNSAHSRQVATFSLRGLRSAHVTPYLTDTSHQLSPQTPVTVKNSAFTATLPPRSLVTYDIGS